MAAIESDLSDIQFLGNWSSHLPSSISSFVSAIVLTPESSPSDIPRTFSRNQTSVVHVGRTPTSDSAFPSDDRATFSNPVMSRNHAKITFADSGSAFVIDTNSHHGTWVSRNAAEFKLAAESPFQLHDGDTLTFGKMVQRNGILHMPLTVAVKLLHSASTPSSMSISSNSLSPASKVASPRLRNRFGLDTSSDSDSSSDNEDEDSRRAEPPTGPNAICVELHSHQTGEHVLVSGSPKSHAIIDVVQSDSSSPGSQKHFLTTSQSFSPIHLPESPINRPSSSSDLLPPPGIELQGIGDPAEAAHKASLSPNTSKSPIPPWRSLSGSPWTNFSIFDRMHGHLQQPSRKVGRLLNPLWMRSSMVAGGEESAGRPDLSSRHTNSGNALDIYHESHDSDHYPKHDQLDHGSGSNHTSNVLHRHSHGQQGFRLDADWGLYGQHGNAMKEVMSLNERLEGLKKDMENLRTKEEGENQRLDLVYHRLDELSSQLQSKVSEDVGNSQQTAFAESINVLKDDITALQNDISILKAHKSAMQTDIRSLLANHDDIEKDMSSVRDISEQHTNNTAALTENTRSLRQDARELRDEFEALRNQSPHIRRDLTTLTDSLPEVHSNIETLLSNMQSTNRSILKIDGEIRDLTIANEDRASRVREQVRSEVMTLIEKGGELSTVTGKRKRGEEGSPDASLDSYTPATSVSRPRKRLRLVADCVAAGALGALGAWFGLAFL